MPERVPPNEGIVLGPDELIRLTGRTRRNAQARVLRCLSIEHKVRPDGSLVVLRAHAEAILSGSLAGSNVKTSEPNWDVL